jgi:hypothetical protein
VAPDTSIRSGLLPTPESTSNLVHEQLWLQEGALWAPVDSGFMPDERGLLAPYGTGQRLSGAGR